MKFSRKYRNSLCVRCKRLLWRGAKCAVGLALVFFITICLHACSGNGSGPNALFANDSIEVFRDSIVVNGSIIHADTVLSHTVGARRDGMPVYTSGSGMADALFAKGTARPVAMTNALEVYLNLPLIHPDTAMARLRELVPTVKPGLQPEGFPERTLDPAWGAAAWEIYCITGSRQWLREAYTTLARQMSYQERVLFAPNGLMHGSLPPSYRHDELTPKGRSATERLHDCSLTVNALEYATIEAAAKMAAELNAAARTRLTERATTMREAVNELFWNPAASSYGSLLYGIHYPILSTHPSQSGNALCILFGIATLEMGTEIVERFSQPMTAAAALAAARTRHRSTLMAGIADTWLATLADGSSAWPTLLMRGIYGMRFTPAAIEFSPCVPQEFPGVKTLRHFAYRNAVLEITLRGTGSKIAGFAIDGTPSSVHAIPAELTGAHRVEITLANNALPDSPRTKSTDRKELAQPRVTWTANGRGTVANHTEGASYAIYVNGVVSEVTDRSAITIAPTGTTFAAVARTGEDGSESFASAPRLFAPEGSAVDIPSSSITPRRAPKQIKDRATATQYIELAARHNTRLTCFANIPEEGDYFVSIDYSNAEPVTAMRTLTVNDRDAGVLICPPVRLGSWVATAPSTVVTVHLNKGVNKLALTYINHTILLHNIHLLRK